jgi:hypothetical protein
MPWHPDDLALGRLRYLLDFDWGGDVYYLSDGAVDVEQTFDGADYTYTAGLEFDRAVRDRSDLFRRSPEERKQAAVVHLAGLVDVPARVAAGHSLRAATGRLWAWIEGTDSRQLLLDGEVREPVYGSPGNVHAVEFTLTENPNEDRALLPDNARAKVLDDVTWSARDEAIEAEWYPMVIGKPGNAGDGTVLTLPFVYATPAQFVDTGADLLLVADGEVGTGKVRVKNFTTNGAANLDLVATADSLGRRVAVVDFTGASWTPTSTAPSAGDDLWVAWDVTSGGTRGLDGSTLEGAGDVVEFFLARSTLRYDAGRIAAIKPRLNAYTLAGYIQPGPDERLSPWEWLRSEVLPLLPVGIRSGPEGIYLVLYDPDASDAVAILDTEINCERESAIADEDGDRYSEIRFAYEYRGEEDKPNAVAVVTGSEVVAAQEGITVDPYLAAGRAQFGERVLEAKSAMVYDSDTATRIASWMARRYALPSRTVSYDVDPVLAWIEPGDVVELTDTELAISRSIAQVDERLIQPDGRLLLVIRLWPRVGDLRS